MHRTNRTQNVHEVFQKIWEQRRKHLYALCMRWTGGNRQEAEDALSRLAIKALEHFPSHADAVSNHSAWLTRLAYNLCVDMYRERVSYSRVIERLASVRRSSDVPVVEAADCAHLRREMQHVILHAFDRLPPGLLEVCRLRFLEDLPYEEIAAQLLLSTEMTRKRVQKARAVLYDALTPYLRDGRAQLDGARRRGDEEVPAAPRVSSGYGLSKCLPPGALGPLNAARATPAQR
jgi:RNA polymerase sigma factor (sigma-70 family)